MCLAPCDSAALTSHPNVGDVWLELHHLSLETQRNIEENRKAMPSWPTYFTNCRRHRRHTRPSAVEDAKVCYSSVTLSSVGSQTSARRTHPNHDELRRNYCWLQQELTASGQQRDLWTGAYCYGHHIRLKCLESAGWRGQVITSMRLTFCPSRRQNNRNNRPALVPKAPL